ncbi:hypothetical protein EBE87_24775 [Pseudoroseomonas wenyumeiae]|uniref:Uncharacterized protein n=2 Tax=Teichococcus wenyumeiae TaxID=2478470 RepID=A0ABX9VCM8_9PROT|nr:hypothetical protein [Pseudoroseomonas wenyumeiae]RMI16935.1 hypothetical protein EBE87_24775 [Pseudoroseomonas wenyumeiae]
MDTLSAPTATPSDPRAAIGRARADLRLAASKAQLEGDPLGPVLDAFGASLGAMGELLHHAEASRQPLDATARAEMTRQLVQACRADFVRQAGVQSRRMAMLSGVGAAVLLLGVLGGGYLWGRSTEVAEVRHATGVIRAALSEGSASAQAWADAIRRNDLVGLLARCEGRAVWSDASGRRACAVPLWLDEAPPPAAPAGPRS